jgi:hypothetical protein
MDEDLRGPRVPAGGRAHGGWLSHGRPAQLIGRRSQDEIRRPSAMYPLAPIGAGRGNFYKTRRQCRFVLRGRFTGCHSLRSNERDNETSVYFVAGRLGNSYTRAISDLGRTIKRVFRGRPKLTA